MEVFDVVRDSDDVERTYWHAAAQVRMGVAARGHVDKADFLAIILQQSPALRVDSEHFGWWPKYAEGPANLTFVPHRPTVADVVWTWWTGRSVFRRGRPGRRGAYPVTYLAIEGDGGITALHDVWNGRAWVDGVTRPMSP